MLVLLLGGWYHRGYLTKQYLTTSLVLFLFSRMFEDIKGVIKRTNKTMPKEKGHTRIYKILRRRLKIRKTSLLKNSSEKYRHQLTSSWTIFYKFTNPITNTRVILNVIIYKNYKEVFKITKLQINNCGIFMYSYIIS